MKIETKYNIGDTVFSCTGNGEIIKVTVESIETDLSFKSCSNNGSIYYRLRPYFSKRIEESEIMTREEAIRKFEADRSEDFLKLFA